MKIPISIIYFNNGLDRTRYRLININAHIIFSSAQVQSATPTVNPRAERDGEREPDEGRRLRRAQTNRGNSILLRPSNTISFEKGSISIDTRFRIMLCNRSSALDCLPAIDGPAFSLDDLQLNPCKRCKRLLLLVGGCTSLYYCVDPRATRRKPLNLLHD